MSSILELYIVFQYKASKACQEVSSDRPVQRQRFSTFHLILAENIHAIGICIQAAFCSDTGRTKPS